MSLQLPGFDVSKLATTFRGNITQKYEILKQLGAGVGGVAYLVRRRTGGDTYCAKEMAGGGDGAAREFEKLKSLQHPNCLRVIELIDGLEVINGRWMKQVWIISELAPGGDLLGYMKRMIEVCGSRALTEEWVARIQEQALKGVAYIHAAGMAHNDLKPENLLVMSTFSRSEPARVPWVVLADFGHAASGAADFHEEGDPRYCSPEAMRAREGGPFPGLQTDMWSMGVVMYEMLSGGILPFLYKPATLDEFFDMGEPALQRFDETVLRQPVVFKPYLDGTSSEAQALLHSLLQKDPTARPSAPSALQHAWFSIQGHPVSEEAAQRLELATSREMSHRILMNAFSARLQREHSRRCWSLFQELDKDLSGHLCLPEFLGSAEALGLSAEAARAAFQEADIDRCGRLSFTEFMAATFDWRSVEPAELRQGLCKLLGQLDADGNGEVELGELTDVFQDTLGPRELEDALRQCDTDGNGKISLRELGSFLFKSESALG